MPKFSPIVLAQSGFENPVGPMDEAGGLHLFVSHPDVVSLPEEGKVTFYFRRGPVTLKEGRGEAGASASVDLTLTEICNVEECEVETPSEPKRAEYEIDRLFAELRKQEGEE